MWILLPLLATLPTTLAVVDNKDITKTHLLSEEHVHIGKIPATLVTPKGYKREHQNKILLYIHGEHTHPQSFELTLPIAKKTGLKVIAIDYSPNYPKTLKDLSEGYKELIKIYSPDHVGIFADSQGASLALSTLIKLKEEKIPLPKAVALLCPWLDRTQQGDSFSLFGKIPCAIPQPEADLNKPLLNPLNASIDAPFPPILLQTGTRDSSLSDSVKLYRKLKTTTIATELDLFEGMKHEFEREKTVEADLASSNIADFFLKNL